MFSLLMDMSVVSFLMVAEAKILYCHCTKTSAKFRCTVRMQLQHENKKRTLGNYVVQSQLFQYIFMALSSLSMIRIIK